MALRIPEVNGASVVLVGSFNPKIFQPEWFARQMLLPAEEVADAKLQVIVPQICQFETERFTIQVTDQRFFAACKPNTEPAILPDLVIGTFFILEHTPVTAMGLNRQMHFDAGSEENWHRLGDKLAPKDGWKAILEGRPGMRSLSIETVIPNGPKLTFRVEPSVSVKFGVFFEMNEHHDAPEKDGLKTLMGTLRDRWEGSQNYAAEVASYILEWSSR